MHIFKYSLNHIEELYFFFDHWQTKFHFIPNIPRQEQLVSDKHTLRNVGHVLYLIRILFCFLWPLVFGLSVFFCVESDWQFDTAKNFENSQMDFLFLVGAKVDFVVLMIILEMQILEPLVASMKLRYILIEMSMIYLFINKFILIFQLLFVEIKFHILFRLIYRRVYARLFLGLPLCLRFICILATRIRRIRRRPFILLFGFFLGILQLQLWLNLLLLIDPIIQKFSIYLTFLRGERALTLRNVLIWILILNIIFKTQLSLHYFNSHIVNVHCFLQGPLLFVFEGFWGQV